MPRRLRSRPGTVATTVTPIATTYAASAAIIGPVSDTVPLTVSRAPQTAAPRAPPACRAVVSTPLPSPVRAASTPDIVTAVIAGIASEQNPSTAAPTATSHSGPVDPATARIAVPSAPIA